MIDKLKVQLKFGPCKMDGLDISTIDQIDQDAFNVSSPDDSDQEEDLPVPDLIGIDSAVQDEEEVRIRKQQEIKRMKTRSETERELELKVMKPDSIRRQILEQSMRDGHQSNASTSTVNSNDNKKGHVMNIVEKAGMSGIDKEKINEIIHEASKGSLFYKKQAQRQAEIHKSIEKMLNKVKNATPFQVANAKITCDKLLKDLEKQRVFNRIVVHFDLDMFFAAVEIRDNPELADKPIAVGGDSMVSTSNYIARRYGVRAAMPGFIARKLCPELLLIKPNGFKYRQASSEVFSVLEEYDPELASMSLDEAYLDLTEYVKNSLDRDGLDSEEFYDGTLAKVWWTRAYEVVSEIREKIYEKTKLTCSAGISCNTLLAKISTDVKKPDGQFMVAGYPDEVNKFIRNTPVEKVSGIGKVSAQFLTALDIKTCGDMYNKRHFLPLVFYDINVKFYLRVALGDGSTCIKSDEQRKSKSVERTFANIKDTLMLLDKLDSICEELCTKYLKPYRIRGRTVTIKLKRNTFTTTTRSYSLLVPTNDKSVIYSTSRNLLLAEIANEAPEISYRLLGVRLSNLADDGVTTNQLTIDSMLRNQELFKTKNPASAEQITDKNDQVIEQETFIGNPDLDETVTNEKIESNSTSSSSEDNSSFKRKEPASKRIDDFFSPDQKQRRQSGLQSKIAAESQNFSESSDFVDGEVNSTNPVSSSSIERIYDSLTAINEVSQREQNGPNDEDFRCPYCFKAYPDFCDLEIHVDNCQFKNSVDVHRTFFTKQKPSHDPKPPTETKVETKKLKLSGSQSTESKKNKSKRQTKLNFQISSSTQKPSFSPESQKQESKTSFYQKFIESNSQRLSQSPKIEPLQCPYCMHGFLDFGVLENHVLMCSKKVE